MKFNELTASAESIWLGNLGDGNREQNDAEVVVRFAGDAGENGIEFDIESIKEVRGLVVINVSSSSQRCT